MGGDDGLISIFLKTTAESLEHCLVHDITKSPMKLAHMFWKLQPDSAIFYDAAFRRFDKVTYKDSACTGWVIDDATLIQALATTWRRTSSPTRARRTRTCRSPSMAFTAGTLGTLAVLLALLAAALAPCVVLLRSSVSGVV